MFIIISNHAARLSFAAFLFFIGEHAIGGTRRFTAGNIPA
jgi:hypothetical protein